MRKVLYFNITYLCNQQCKFCFSHNTSIDNTNSHLKLEDFQKILSWSKAQKQDRIILNGGEPTLNPDFLTISASACSTGAEVILYSNGLKFVSKKFTKETLNSSITRITIPIHGDSGVHDFITGIPNSFAHTLEGIQNIASYAEYPVLELKFIVSDLMFKSNFSIIEFLGKSRLLDKCASIVITGQVETNVAVKNNFILHLDFDFMKYIERQILDLLPVAPLKIYDLPFCRFPASLRTFLSSCVWVESDIQFHYYIFDYLHHCPHVVEYNSYRAKEECLNCMFRSICRSILDGYLVPQVSQGTVQLVME